MKKSAEQKKHEQERAKRFAEWDANSEAAAKRSFSELDAMNERGLPSDPVEQSLWYDRAEDHRERAMGIPAGADPIDVMMYIHERAKAHKEPEKKKRK